MAKDKRDRRQRLQEEPRLPGTFDRQRFEQEVAEEIGISLDRALGRASRRARNATASPGATPGAGEVNRLEDKTH